MYKGSLMDDLSLTTLRTVADAVRSITGAADEDALREEVARISFPAVGLRRLECGVGSEPVRVVDGDDSPAGRAILDTLNGLVAFALQRLRRPPLEGEIYFEQLFNAAPEAIVVLDDDDRIVRANPEFENMFGYSMDESRGRTINELIVPEEHQNSAYGLTSAVAMGHQVQEETVRRRKDGSLLNVSILGTPIMASGDQVAVYGIYRDITSQKEAEEALRRLSTTDELTGLFNRRGFFLVAEQQRRLAVRRKAELLMLYIDVDDFKLINDTWGHQEGDQVLADLAEMLRHCYRDSDILARVTSETGEEGGLLARMGGDEFVVLAVDAGEDGDKILTDRLRERIAEYNRSCGDRYHLSLSMGVVRVRPEPSVTIDSLLAEADKLMYEKKRERL
jgi:diguanylate cyclase (GGDEF)-like protein/PAS domain S-box-containing protein